MSSYSVAEAKNDLPKLLDRMLSGEEVVITRRGKPIGRLQPIEPPAKPQPKVDLEWLRSVRVAASTNVEPTIDTVRAMRDEYRY